VCENKATGFFVVDNTILGTADSIVYKDTPEEDCLTTCSTNRDRFGRSILCASFVYDHASFTCTIFKEKAKPEGKADVVQAVGKRYFEKVCLGDDVPMECADSQFIRADDSVLIGFARNVTLVETMEQCVEQCVKESDCKVERIPFPIAFHSRSVMIHQHFLVRVCHLIVCRQIERENR
ncbi:PAN domain protein, partial [Cooperia oncophora]